MLLRDGGDNAEPIYRTTEENVIVKCGAPADCGLARRGGGDTMRAGPGFIRQSPKEVRLMYRVVKCLDFCYGHRLQDYEGKCKHLHGHNGRVEIEMAGDTLDRRGMVTDFGDIKRVMKVWIDENLDHRMLLREDDPALEFIRSAGEPHYTMKENPTAEAIARLIFGKARELGLAVSRVTLWETPDSFATYSEE
jgi:6-pyruvoyltetrahydropterin/6-carboxytetrahydropterin synthase